MTTATAVFPWLEDWKLAVQGWSQDGSLARAGQSALNLDAVPFELQRLIEHWSDSQWDELPPVELLTNEAMPGAAGAYAISTGTIYLNQSWLESASPEQVQAVLTEELGHHLDGLLNAVDTPGDEGDVFAQLLADSTGFKQVQEEDQIHLRLGDQLIRAEANETEEKFQALFAEQDVYFYTPGSQLEIPILYTGSGNTNDPNGANKTIGVGFVVSWDSSALELLEIDYDPIHFPFGAPYSNGEEATFAAHSLLGAFPNAPELPATISTLKFYAKQGSHGGSEGEPFASSINIEIKSTSSGFSGYSRPTFLVNSATIEPSAGESLEILDSNSIIFFTDENSGSGQKFLISGFMAQPSTSFSFSPLLKFDDRDYFAINELTGEITMLIDPDYESKSGYSLSVTANDSEGNSEQKYVSILVNDRDDTPAIISSPSADAIYENIGAGQVVHTVEAVDESSITFSLQPGQDETISFRIDELSGEVTLLENPDYELKSSYGFTVVVTDTAGNIAEQEVTLAVRDVDENLPVFTSQASIMPIDENSGSGQIIYTAEAIDESSISYSLKPDIGDASFFSIDDLTGEVILLADPDYESKLSYAFTVVATDAAGNAEEQAVTLAIGDLDENAPVFTSLPSAVAIDENTGAGQIIYRAKATDESSFTYELMPDNGDVFAFNIDKNSGDVLLLANPDFELKTHYGFTVVATDAAGNKAEQEVTLAINDLDEDAPVFLSPTSAVAINENKAAGRIIYTANATDESTISYSLRPGIGDAFAFSIDEITGEVKLQESPDYESKSSYAFAVVATDTDGNAAEQVVSLAINDLPEIVANHAPNGSIFLTGIPRPFSYFKIHQSNITDEDGIETSINNKWQYFDSEENAWIDHPLSEWDPTYTILPQDVGKLIRGQVFYIDGNGLVETISSDPILVRAAFSVPDIYQAVATSPEEIAYRPGGSIHLPLIYNVSTSDANLSGLTLNVHYDSTLLAPEGSDHGVSGMIDAAISTSADLPDVDDLDYDPATDRMVQLVWASFDNSFPGQNLPAQLATVSFASLEDPSVHIDTLTGSWINFTASATASGYGFLPSTTTLTPRLFDLDVDGDGEVTALGDGLMIIRKLFGPAFAGDKLTDKAISPDATRTTEEIHQFIQDGIDAGDLDVDQDDKTTPLGDGLMVIRHLFGPAFEGPRLTDKAISPDSPFYGYEGHNGIDAAWEIVAANIDALIL